MEIPDVKMAEHSPISHARSLAINNVGLKSIPVVAAKTDVNLR